MQHEARVLLVMLCVLAGACSKLERLSIVKPTAERGDYTQVAPTYDVSDKGRTGTPMAAGEQLASANELFRGGKFAQAEQLAQRALKSNPKLGDAHVLLAMVASARGDAASTGRHYQQALAIAPGNGVYANNYGAWLCGNGRAAGIAGLVRSGLADPAYPTRAAAFANAGSCAHGAGQLARAEANWRQAMALDPVNVPALSGMAELQFRNGRYLDARAFAERWLAAAPADIGGLRLAAQIEQKLGDNAAAQRYLLRLQDSFRYDDGTTRAMTDNSFDPTDHALDGCGARLRKSREDAGLSIDDVAARLHMPGRVVRSLEAEDWSRLGAPVFVRGQVRSYSRLLGLTTAPMMAALTDVGPVEPSHW